MLLPGQDTASSRSDRRKARGRRWMRFTLPVVCSLVVLAAVAFVYRPFVLAEPGRAYPSGVDSWGHLFKAKYVADRVGQGDFWPVLLPWWYDGLEVFRYWSPLPIYVLAGLGRLAGDVFVGGAWLIPLAAAFGGLSWLLYSRRLGWTAALVAGLAWAVWPDHIYLGLAEGNLPRVVGTALLPLAFLCFLDALELKRWPWPALGVVALIHLEILCHAMVGAMVCVAFAVFAVVYWLLSAVSTRDVLRGVSLLALGVISSAWWLLPSLSGGITSIPASALREKAAAAMPGVFTPSDPRAFFVGLVSLALLTVIGLTWKRRPALARAAGLCALAGVLLPIPQVMRLYFLLPFSQLMWPARYTGLTAVPLILAFVAWSDTGAPRRWWARPVWLTAAGVTVLLALSVSNASHLLYRPTAIDAPTYELCRQLASQPGWRVCHVTPWGQPAYLESDIGGREQIYGYASEGAKIRPQLVLMEEAMNRGDYSFAVDRAEQCGATDLVVDSKVAGSASFAAAAAAKGFDLRRSFGALTLLSKPGGPRAFVSPYRVLAVGRLAGIASTLFPCVETGRPALDSYTEDELARYDTVFLTGVEWKSKARAEQLVRAYLARGGRVVVDLTRFPAEVLSGQPSFLGVSASPVSLESMPALKAGGATLELGFLSHEYQPWVTHFLQGLDRVDASFDYYGQSAPVLGSKFVDGVPVTFVGMNLPYHAYLTRNAQTLDLLGGLLGVEPGVAPAREALPLEDYLATSRGWTFDLEIPERLEGRLLILPFATPDSLSVWVDGNKVKVSVVENLIGIAARAGRQKVRVEVGLPPLMPVSGLVSLLSTALVVAYAATEHLRAGSRAKEVTAPDEEEACRPF